MYDWFQKLRIKFLYHLAKTVEIKPFLFVDPNSYCPACGHSEGEIQAVDLAKPDDGGSLVGVAHACKVCKYQWVEQAVTVIKQKIFVEEETEEEMTFREMAEDKRTKNVRGIVKVNRG